jgi:hypothetical protein
MKIQLANNRQNDICGVSCFFPATYIWIQIIKVNNTNYLAHFKYIGAQNYQLHTWKQKKNIYINLYVEKESTMHNNLERESVYHGLINLHKHYKETFRGHTLSCCQTWPCSSSAALHTSACRSGELKTESPDEGFIQWQCRENNSDVRMQHIMLRNPRQRSESLYSGRAGILLSITLEEY